LLGTVSPHGQIGLSKMERKAQHAGSVPEAIVRLPDTQQYECTPHHADLIVHSKLIPAHGAPVTLNYRMRGSGNDWKVVDVYLEGTISQLAVRRSEFTAILHSEGPDKLLATLQDQSDRLLKGN